MNDDLKLAFAVADRAAELAPWILVVEEAGGRFTDRSGGRAPDLGGGLNSDAALHAELLDWLQYPQTGERPSPFPKSREAPPFVPIDSPGAARTHVMRRARVPAVESLVR